MAQKNDVHDEIVNGQSHVLATKRALMERLNVIENGNSSTTLFNINATRTMVNDYVVTDEQMLKLSNDGVLTLNLVIRLYDTYNCYRATSVDKSKPLIKFIHKSVIKEMIMKERTLKSDLGRWINEFLIYKCTNEETSTMLSNLIHPVCEVKNDQPVTFTKVVTESKPKTEQKKLRDGKGQENNKTPTVSSFTPLDSHSLPLDDCRCSDDDWARNNERNILPALVDLNHSFKPIRFIPKIIAPKQKQYDDPNLLSCHVHNVTVDKSESGTTCDLSDVKIRKVYREKSRTQGFNLPRVDYVNPSPLIVLSNTGSSSNIVTNSDRYQFPLSDDNDAEWSDMKGNTMVFSSMEDKLTKVEIFFRSLLCVNEIYMKPFLRYLECYTFTNSSRDGIDTEHLVRWLWDPGGEECC